MYTVRSNEQQTVRTKATGQGYLMFSTRMIVAGEELFFSYGHPYWLSKLVAAVDCAVFRLLIWILTQNLSQHPQPFTYDETLRQVTMSSGKYLRDADAAWFIKHFLRVSEHDSRWQYVSDVEAAPISKLNALTSYLAADGAVFAFDEEICVNLHRLGGGLHGMNE